MYPNLVAIADRKYKNSPDGTNTFSKTLSYALLLFLQMYLGSQEVRKE